MHQTLGLIGSGMIGGAPARLAVAAGLDVVLSNSSGPEALSGLVAELGEHARAATPAEAARAGDLVAATIVQPYMAARPEGLSQEETQRWFFDTPGVPVPADRVRELTTTEVRGPAGGARAALAQAAVLGPGHRLPRPGVEQEEGTALFRLFSVCFGLTRSL
ncbi:NAD(P)-binding domain-containing protein [Streptomyces scopuliridis]|uniref:NAD(P)-binding domain-containing protein n=1 Tax=Streptomyces scopuliridis TaxID=452529 RepID=UPI0036C83C51